MRSIELVTTIQKEAEHANEEQAIYTVNDILEMVDSQAGAVLAALGTLGLVTIKGRLGPVKNSNYEILYYIELRQADGAGPVLKIHVPKKFHPELYEGQLVTVQGRFVALHGITSLALKVSRLTVAEGNSQEIVAEHGLLRNIFLKPNAGEVAFPPLEEVSITYIYGKTAQVVDDFLDAFHGIDGLNFESIEVNMTDPQSITSGVMRARGSIVCLLRGGGSAGDFEVFNTPCLLAAWRDLKAFKITAIGHAQNTTMLDCFSSKVAITPTEAGRWIKSKIALSVEALRIREDNFKLQAENAVLRNRINQGNHQGQGQNITQRNISEIKPFDPGKLLFFCIVSLVAGFIIWKKYFH